MKAIMHILLVIQALVVMTSQAYEIEGVIDSK